jgi:hypothetical protein
MGCVPELCDRAQDAFEPVDLVRPLDACAPERCVYLDGDHTLDRTHGALDEPAAGGTSQVLDDEIDACRHGSATDELGSYVRT